MDLNIIIIFFLFIVMILLMMILYNKKLEHLTVQSDEAIQNISSLYNKDQLTIGNLNVTKQSTIEDKMTTKDLVTTGTFNLLPKGIIVAWNGGITPPAGWALCNGQNGTPDLSERFILATTNQSYLDNYKTGGSGSVTLGVANLPDHSHRLQIEPTGGWNGSTPQGSDRSERSSNNTGSCNGCAGQAFSVWNPYYRLAYIMKL